MILDAVFVSPYETLLVFTPYSNKPLMSCLLRLSSLAEL